MTPPRSKIERKHVSSPSLRKVNECFLPASRFSPPEPLFDEFWRSGELALLFGASGTGKSVLAAQLAEALARGRALPGFCMPKRRSKVLYVDLGLSDKQFQARYAIPGERDREQRFYNFADNFNREQPPSVKELGKWLRAQITRNRVRVVIIDSLADVKETCDGTRQTLPLMRELRQLTREFNVSILAIIDSSEPGPHRVREDDLKRSRVLCSVADSAFAIADHPNNPGDSYLIQTRTKSGPVVWTLKNAPKCRLQKMGSGMLGFIFDERFREALDDETRELICSIKRLRDDGKTYRAIEAEMDISRSRAWRLMAKWTPAMAEEQDSGKTVSNDQLSTASEDEDQVDDKDDAQYKRDVGLDDSVHETRDNAPSTADGQPPADGRRSVYDLPVKIDGWGREIYIESEDPYTRLPTVWYKIDKDNQLTRHVRYLYHIRVTRLGPAPYLPDDVNEV